MSRTRSAGWSVSGRSAASSARSIPYLAISSAALAVRACASAGVAPTASALASSLRTRASSVSVGWGPAVLVPAAWGFTKWPPAQGVWIEYVIEGYPWAPTFPAPRLRWRHPIARPAAGARVIEYKNSPGTSLTREGPAAYTRPHVCPNGTKHPVLGLRQAGRRGRGGLRCRRMAARRCHGQPLRAEPYDRPPRGRGAAQARQPATGLSSDDRGSRPLGAGLRGGWRAERHHPCGGGRVAGADAPDDQVSGGTGRTRAQSRDPGGAVRRSAAGDRHAAADDRRARVRRSAVPGLGAAEAAPRPRACQPARRGRMAAGRRRGDRGHH